MNEMQSTKKGIVMAGLVKAIAVADGFMTAR